MYYQRMYDNVTHCYRTQDKQHWLCLEQCKTNVGQKLHQSFVNIYVVSFIYSLVPIYYLFIYYSLFICG